MAEDKAILVTKKGHEQLLEELDFLQKTERKRVAARLKEAISYGDLSENSEYEDAKNEQAVIEGRILELEQKLKNIKVIEEDHKNVSKVQLGTKVQITDASKKKKEIQEFVIVGSTEADPMANKISNESPVGSALIGKKKGDVVTVKVPAGVVKYELLKLE